MKKISKFDLNMIIAFVGVTLIGGGVWYWLSGQLDDALNKANAAQQHYKSLSTNNGIVVSRSNQKTLQDNIGLYIAQINPLLQDKFLSKGNALTGVQKEDSVTWKHNLNEELNKPRAAAKDQGVALPAAYYFSFRRYTNQSPDDEQTVVLTKQLITVNQLATLLIKAPVK